MSLAEQNFSAAEQKFVFVALRNIEEMHRSSECLNDPDHEILKKISQALVNDLSSKYPSSASDMDIAIKKLFDVIEDVDEKPTRLKGFGAALNSTINNPECSRLFINGIKNFCGDIGKALNLETGTFNVQSFIENDEIVKKQEVSCFSTCSYIAKTREPEDK